jgi:molecular chaperone GrpE
MSEEQKIATPAEGAESADGAQNQQAAPQDQLAALQAKLAQAEAQAAEYKDQYLRAAADYKNFKRRVEIERAELARSAGADLLLKLLPVVDDFDRAVASVPAEIAETPWWGGTQLVAHKLRLLLESQSVKPIEALGQEFDPNFHEAVLYEDAPGQDGKVIAELQKGYKLGDRVLRPSMVKVGRG